MEISSDAEKQLHENLQKCRCCFRMLIDDRRALSISDEVRDIFLFLTGIQLLDSDIFADRICQLCSSDLKVFANLRDDLIVKQKTLYALAGIDEDHFTNKSVPLEQMDEDEDLVQEDDNSQDFDLNFETVEDAHFEDEMEGEFINEDTAEAEEEATTAAEAAVIKIEKVQDGSEETLVTDFDFFEEIVGDEEGMDEESTYEMVDSMKDEL